MFRQLSPSRCGLLEIVLTAKDKTILNEVLFCGHLFWLAANISWLGYLAVQHGRKSDQYGRGQGILTARMAMTIPTAQSTASFIVSLTFRGYLMLSSLQ